MINIGDTESEINRDLRTHTNYTKIPASVICVSKKAIMECDEEWAMNKKVVDLASKNIRQAVRQTLVYD